MQHRWSLGSEEIPNFRAPHHHHHHMAVFGRKDGIGISVEASNMVAPRSKERERERESRTCTIAHRVHVHVFRSTDPGQVSILLGSFALAPRSVSCRTNESKDKLEENVSFFVPWSKGKGSYTTQGSRSMMGKLTSLFVSIQRYNIVVGCALVLSAQITLSQTNLGPLWFQ